MAIFKRKVQPVTEDVAPPPRQVMASAVPLTGPEAPRYLLARGQQTTESWQNDAWYFYDAIGELTGPTNWIANAVSKADLFGAEVDLETGMITGPTEDARAQRAAALCLGGAARRAQLQFILAVCWQIPGEAYVVVRGRAEVRGVPQPDEWLALSGQKVRPTGSRWKYQDPVTLEWIELGDAGDRLIRVWSPHPNDQNKANSAVRSALPVLREIEKSSMNLASVLDSRIATVGMQIIPSEVDLTADAFTDMYLESVSAGLTTPGTAAAQTPIAVTIPAEYIDAFVKGRMTPDTAMDQTVIDLRDNDLSRLAAALDMPKSVAEGTQGESNHWSAWQVEESTYKIFIEPLLDRLGDALTEFWYRPVLRAMGIEDPERYTLAWDTTGIVARPDSTADLDHLYDLGLISDDYRRQASGIPDDAIPSDEESQRRLLERVVLGAPTLAGDPRVAQELFGFEVAPEAAGISPAGSQAIEEGTDGTEDAPETRALPAAPESSEDVPEGLVAAATYVVFDALSRAGGRLLTREHRGQFADTPKQDLYLTLPYTGSDIDRLLSGSFCNTEGLARGFGLDTDRFSACVRSYAEYLLSGKRQHDPRTLRRWLREDAR